MAENRGVARRRVLQLMAAGVAGGGGMTLGVGRALAAAGVTTLGDGRIALGVADDMRTQVQWVRDGKLVPLTAFSASETLLLKGRPSPALRVTDQSSTPLRTEGMGAGTRHTVVARSAEGIEQTLEVSFYERHPGFALLRVRFRNDTAAPLKVAGWTVADHVLPGRPARQPAFWSFAGASHEDRRDWVQPVGPGFAQRNFLGMNASDYGGGTPVADVWRRDAGLAVGHVERHPALVSLPVTAVANGVRLAVASDQELTLAPGASLETPTCFLHAHTGDYFASLEGYRQLMADQGLSAPAAPESAFGPIWCAWGYERNFTVAEVEGTLGKARDMGFEWAVLDDGWQTSEGDWYVDRGKFPRGEADIVSFAEHIKAAGMKPRLWLSPLAVNPGTDLLHDHTDMLLLDKNGAVQNISWWNAFYLCPAYQPTIDYYEKLVTRILGEWGYAGLKLDGQHLNGVAPCYNPAHRHARPEESVEGLEAFWETIYRTAMRINPEAVIELCPCGTSFAFHNIAAMNQTPASDPESSWQVRHKGKTLKALLGQGGSFAGDHVELSEHGRDFASTVGIGGVVSTKFTWPADTPHPTAPQPPGGYRLTPEKEAVWRHWVALYKDKMLPKGRYLGRLYDIGFDRPEAHAIEREGRLYYAFYAANWNGAIELRGLAGGRYRVRNYVDGVDLGEVTASEPLLRVAFEHYLLLEALPA